MSEPETQCKTCGSKKWWRECYNCDEGYSHHDCGDDTCVCFMPENNVRCDICRGNGGWHQCSTCHPWED